MIKKLDFKQLAEKIKKTIKDPDEAKFISTGADLLTPTQPEDFVVMPEWWKEATGGLLGLPFGYAIMIAGNSDSGKTSSCIEAMKAAQAQGIAVILADTERKTTKARLTEWGVNPDQLARVSAPYLERMYRGVEMWIDALKANDPDLKILVIIDSLGNTGSFREAEVEDMEGSQQPGVAAKINKRGLKRLIPRLEKEKISLLIVNQTYDLMGSPGKKNTGGTGPDYFSALTFQTSRVKWLEIVQKGVQKRVGARVQWTVYKNHLTLESNINKRVLLDITKEGFKVVNSGTSSDTED